jgi:hypothetical protein
MNTPNPPAMMAIDCIYHYSSQIVKLQLRVLAHALPAVTATIIAAGDHHTPA